MLTVAPDGISLVAHHPAGLFHGVQTLRQLLPAAIEGVAPAAGPWTIPAVRITDRPRFAWRGAMLDVTRHFFGKADVERFVDLLAYYKMNRLHLHLSDDQGWRIAIDAWPQLTAVGGASQVGGATGAFYFTKADYAELVAYAADRYITVVPEIDMPGHTNAALASYAELNCDGTARSPYTGTEVGFSSLCMQKDVTRAFITDVVRELAAATPGPYLHVGGDEARSTDPADYTRFMEDVQQIVASFGKQPIGWEELATTHLQPTAIVQQWHGGMTARAIAQGAKVILSPANRIYLDMKYNPRTPLGLTWAGTTDVGAAYDWDPATLLPGLRESDILGVEAPLWTETITQLTDIEYMAMPRLAGVAEIGWTPQARRRWDEYRRRLSAHAAHLQAMGVGFYRSPQVAW
jgi:hexosaminidase